MKKNKGDMRCYHFVMITMILYLSLAFGCDKSGDFIDCKIQFKELGIKDFELGITFKDLNEEFPGIEKTMKEKENRIKQFTTYEEENIIGKKRKVAYTFLFKDNILIGYYFQITANKELSFFKSFVKITKECGKNKDFINEESPNKYFFVKKGGNCYKYLKTSQDDLNELIIEGGISTNN